MESWTRVPFRGESVTLICLAPGKHGISTGLMHLHGSEKVLTLFLTMFIVKSSHADSLISFNTCRYYTVILIQILNVNIPILKKKN